MIVSAYLGIRITYLANLLHMSLVRVFTGRVHNFPWQMIGGQFWSPYPQKTLFWDYLPIILYCLSLNFGVLFLLFTSIAPLSGRVPCTRCQISAGARAPVAPALTRALLRYLLVRAPNRRGNALALHSGYEYKIQRVLK